MKRKEKHGKAETDRRMATVSTAKEEFSGSKQKRRKHVPVVTAEDWIFLKTASTKRKSVSLDYFFNQLVKNWNHDPRDWVCLAH